MQGRNTQAFVRDVRKRKAAEEEAARVFASDHQFAAMGVAGGF